MDSDAVVACIRELERAEPTDACPDVKGDITTPRVPALLNALVNAMNPRELYLEVGVLRGKSLIGALKGNTAKAVAVDNFARDAATHDAPPRLIMENLNRHGITDRVVLVNADFQRFLRGGQTVLRRGSVGVYFYDALHTRFAHHAGLVLAEPFLAKDAFVVVDDWGAAEEIRDGTRQAVEETGAYCLIAERPANAGWHNGIAVFRHVTA